MTAAAMTIQPRSAAADSCERIKFCLVRGDTDGAMNELRRLKASSENTAEMILDWMSQIAEEIRELVNNMSPKARFTTGEAMSRRLSTVMSQARK